MTLFSKVNSKYSNSTNEINNQTLTIGQLRQVIGGSEDDGGMVRK